VPAPAATLLDLAQIIGAAIIASRLNNFFIASSLE
jgi:hypothetical protein